MIFKLSTNIKNIDYYTIFNISININNKEYILLQDNILYLKNLFEFYINNKDSYILDYRLVNKNLGLLLNKYYNYIYNDIFDNDLIIENNKWIGEKYNICTNAYNATWIYKYKEKIFLKITPIFSKFEQEQNILEYSKFLNNYKDIACININIKDLEYLYEIIIEKVKKIRL